MPSRAILLIGGLGFVCLILMALLALQLTTTEADPDVPALQAAAPAETTEPPEHDVPALSVETQVSLQNAHDEPMLAELVSFLDAVHVRVGVRNGPLAPVLRPYFLDLVQRMNAEHEAYRATLFAPSRTLAERRADRLRLLFLDAGLTPDLLTLTGHTGSDGVVVERS